MIKKGRMTDPKFLEANAAKLAKMALESEQELDSIKDTLVEEVSFGRELSSEQVHQMALRIQELRRKLGGAWKAPVETDWHAEAQMYANVVGRIKDLCNMTHQIAEWEKGRVIERDCQCPECTIKRRCLRIIADNLK